MVNKHMKRCLATYISRKFQIKITIHLLEWPKSRALRTPNADWDIEKKNHKIHCGGNAKR